MNERLWQNLVVGVSILLIGAVLAHALLTDEHASVQVPTDGTSPPSTTVERTTPTRPAVEAAPTTSLPTTTTNRPPSSTTKPPATITRLPRVPIRTTSPVIMMSPSPSAAPPPTAPPTTTTTTTTAPPTTTTTTTT